MEELKNFIDSYFNNLFALIDEKSEELKSLILNSKTAVRKKRKPSAYNLFMKDCVKKETTGAYPERFKKCAHKYKEAKSGGTI